MAVGKEVKTKITSIKSTQKITSAMEMVAASKMRRATDRMALGKPYAENIRKVIGNVANSSSEYHHRYMTEREVKNVGFIVVASDRGLCGGLNINLFKQVLRTAKQYHDADVGVKYCSVGAKAMSFFNKYGGDVLGAVRDLGDSPSAEDLLGNVKIMLDAFDNGEIDRLYLAGNDFVNTMTQSPEVTQLLPLPKIEKDDMSHHWDYVYEPDDAGVILEGLLIRYVESQVYQAVVENKACEMAARMLAMKNATDNAGDIIDELQLLYNKARQAAITQELSEIVAGAAAV